MTAKTLRQKMKSNITRTVWLSSLILKIDGTSLYLDCYGTEAPGTWIICSKNFNGETTVVDAWSYKHE